MLAQHEKAIRPMLAGAVLLSFLLPFMNITCAGQQIASVSGIDMVLGKKLDKPDMFGGQSGFMDQSSQQSTNDMPFVMTDAETGETLNTSGSTVSMSGEPDGMGAESGEGNIEANPIAMGALATALIAMFTAFGADRRKMMISAVCAGLTAVLLFVLKTVVMKDIPSEMMGVLEINWVEGFWIALCASAVLCGITAKFMPDESSNSRPRPRAVIQTYSTDSQPTHPLNH